MAGEVDLPAVGRVDKRWVYAGMAAIAGIVGFVWWRRGQETQTELDPLTGEPYQAAGGSYRNPNPDASGADVEGGADDGPSWSQKILAALPLYGYEPDFVATTLGKYFAGGVLNGSEQDLIRTAWALFGKPPGAPAINSGGSTPPPTSPPPAPGPRPPTPRRTAPTVPTSPVPPRRTPFLPVRRG